jgi:ClpP class serine protease
MWLLEASVRQALQQAQKSGFMPSAEQQAQFDARFGNGDVSANDNRLLTVAGNNAEISVKGVITKSPSFMAMLFGGGNTTYPEIISAIAAAEQDDTVSNITFAIDSPGGHFDGLFDTLAAIQAAKKPTKAVISNVGASAAFAIASQADEVTASNIAARIGSVGVVVTFMVDENEISIASTDAPKKRPDITTAEGIAMVREELDAMHEIFVDAIAEGRDVTADKVNADFGQGATVLANEALKRGMIDAVATSSLKVVKSTKTTTAISGNQPEANNMDLKQLQAQHPETFAAAVQQGTTEERDRVSAHLMMGESSGDMKTASASIKDGSGMTATLQATYMTAGMNRSDVATRQDDDAGANAGDNANADDSNEGAQAIDVASLIEAKLGLGDE